VQTKDGEAAWEAGDRMADKFFDQVKEEPAGLVKQKSVVKPKEQAIAVAAPKALPSASSLTGNAKSALGTLVLSAWPENAEVSVDGDFVGNAR
jgi:hypothetical protein